jgi:hypothetical protein
MLRSLSEKVVDVTLFCRSLSVTSKLCYLNDDQYLFSSLD